MKSLAVSGLNVEMDAAYGEVAERRRQLQERLNAKLKMARGMDWELLSLEFRRDLWLLAVAFDGWARIMDSEFRHRQSAAMRINASLEA
jgi:hypothetical protein